MTISYHHLKKPFFSAISGRFTSFLFFVCVLVCFESSGFATWKKLSQFAVTVNASFFFNEQQGLIGLDGANGIFRTTNGGQLWQHATTPAGFTGYITDIFMRDSLHGWATIEETDNAQAHGLWSTTDGGATWQANTALTGDFCSVYQTTNALIVLDRYTSNGLTISTDGGVTFFKVISAKFTGINFTDDLHGVAIGLSGTSYYTVDGGRSWRAASLSSVEAWSVYARKGTSTFVVVPEKLQSDPLTTEFVEVTTSFDGLWQTKYVLAARTTGHVAGTGPVMYVQCAIFNPDNPKGLVRSTDGGISWTSVGGPTNYRDTRFSVMGCSGAICYAFDGDGGVWKTTDGGNGDLHEFPNAPVTSSASIDLTSSPCAKDTATLIYSNLSCIPLRIESLGFSDSTNILVTSGALSFLRFPSLPKTYDPDVTDSLIFVWDPAKLGTGVTQSKIFVHIRGRIPNTTTVFDTLIPVHVSLSGMQSGTPVITFQGAIAGHSTHELFMVTNTNPTGPILLSHGALATPDSTYDLTQVNAFLPRSLAALDSMSLVMGFTPHDTAAHPNALILTTDCGNLSIPLAGHAKTGLISAKDHDFGICAVGDTICEMVVIQNIGNAPFVVTNGFLLSDNVNYHVDRRSLPTQIPVGEKLEMDVCFHPQSEGRFIARVDWSTDLDPTFAQSIRNFSILNGRTVNAAVHPADHALALQLRPNPAHDELRLELGNASEKEMAVEIFDALGKKVYTGKTESGKNVMHIDTRNLPTGMYVLRIGDTEQNFVKE